MEARITCESHMAVDTVNGDTEESRAESFELGRKFLIENELVAGDSLPVKGIEHEDDWLANEPTQGDTRRRRMRQSELRTLRPNG